MDWLKNNLVLVITGAVALLLVGGSGYYFYSRFSEEKAVEAQLTQTQENLTQLLSKDPFPSEENVKKLKEEEKKLSDFKHQAEAFFRPFSATNITNSAEFNSVIQRTLYELQRGAQSANVTLPTNFGFAFTAQRELLQFDTNSLNIHAEQLSDIKALCQVLYQARIYEIMALKRASVSTNDTASMEAQPQDYLRGRQITTNDTVKAVVAPYEASFKCSSAELGAVLEGLARTSQGFIVKAVKVEPGDTEGGEEAGFTGGESTSPVMDTRRMLMMRYGRGYRPPPPPGAAAAAAATTTPTTGKRLPPGVMLIDRPLRATLMLEVVKFLNAG